MQTWNPGNHAKGLCRRVAFAAFIFLAWGAARAGSISGAAVSDSGAPLIFASVEVYDASGGLTGSGTVQLDGTYSVAGLGTVPVSFLSVAATPTEVATQWDALAGATYQVRRADDPATANWTDAPDGVAPDEQSRQTAAADEVVTYMDTAPSESTACYQIQVVP
jgi:hypothetical protein